MTVSFYNGEVADNAAAPGDLVRVSVPNLSYLGRKVFGPMRFQSRILPNGTLALPARGDKAVIGNDDTAVGEQWIIAWHRDGIDGALDFPTQSEFSAHAALTTTAHGGLVSPAQLSALQTEVDAHEILKTGMHGVPAMANGQGIVWNGSDWIATDIVTAAELEADARMTNARAPTGNAGGDLTGTYPNPTIAAGALTLAELGISRGTNTVSITNGVSANSGNISHGLSGTPATILGTARHTGDSRDDYVVDIATRGGTSFIASVRGAAAEAYPLGNPTVVTFDWIAII